MKLQRRTKQSEKEYWLKIRLSQLYFGHYNATEKEIHDEIERRKEHNLKESKAYITKK